MVKFFILILTGIIFLSIPARVDAAQSPSYVQKYIPSAKMVGSGRLTFLFTDVYDAALYSSDGSFKKGKPLALSLSYLRALKGSAITKTTIDEIRRLGFTDAKKLETWNAQLSTIFPDVKSGQTITGIQTKSGKTIFYKDAQKIGEIADPTFGPIFFNIWLDPKTRVPDLRARLLGL